ncbi:MAG: hypothetical protein ACU833_04750 [Gammaproteobacteria bacterium]
MTAALRGVLASVVFLAYPYLVYRGMESGVVWTAPALISGLYVYQAFKTGNPRTRTLKLAAAGCLVAGAVFLQSVTAKLLPVIIQLTFMFFFGKTLLKGRPLIERFVRLEFPVFPPGISEYCRQLTVMWTGFFAFNAVMCAALAVWAPDFWWAVYNGVLIFVLTGVLMVGEYVYRHFRFPELDIPKPAATIKTMVLNGRKIWLDVHAN